MTTDPLPVLGGITNFGPWQASDIAVLRSVSIWEGDRCVADVEVYNSDDKSAIDRARLMAASPELLAALQHILAGAVSLPRFAEDEARAAISKATGAKP